MRSNKKIFWISIFVGIVSIVLMILFHWLSIRYVNQKDIYTAIENIFISLVGGAFLSSVTAFIGFYNTKRKFIVDFASNYVDILNNIKYLHNLMNWHYRDIKYLNCQDPKLQLTDDQKDEQQKIYDIDNNRYIPMIYNAIREIATYNYNRMHEILDDYTGLWILNKNPKARFQMKIMMDEAYKYHILHKKCNIDYQLYEQKDYDNYLFYTKVITEYYKTCEEVTMEHLHEEYQMFLNITKINEYLKSIYNGLVSIEKDKEKNKD